MIRQVGLAPTKARNICSMSKVSLHLAIQQHVRAIALARHFHICLRL